MDNIICELDKHISYLSSFHNDKMQLINYYRIKIEYGLICSLAVLWNKNLQTLDLEAKEYVMNQVIRPSIGSVIDICRRLDTTLPSLFTKSAKKALNAYPDLRNKRLGHGFVFADGEEQLLCELKKCAEDIYMGNHLLSSDCDLILVLKENNNKYEGMGIRSDGNYYHWSCPREVREFDLGNVYMHDTCKDDYHRLSPFIHITEEREYFIFRSCEDQLIGKILYSQLLKTGETCKCWDSWGIDVDEEHNRTKSINGTVINCFDRNFKSYIDIGIKREILSFLKNNRSSVCATIWGHGGVGKTATVQKVCDELYRAAQKSFDYIIFLSAKDRYYDQYTGKVQYVGACIDSFEDIITAIMDTLGVKNTAAADFNIRDCKSSCFIIIDDYETFASREKMKIEQWIKSLDINYHKVIITTRANTIIGQEFQTNELSIEQTKNFLTEFIKNEYSDFYKHAMAGLNNKVIESIQSITSGRPLFLLQFVHLWVQYGSIDRIIDKQINASESAVDFLYGRLYNYLSSTARLLFVAISQIVSGNDLSNLIDKLKYITNLENKEDDFQKAFQELCKLRIVEIYNDNFFKVYSVEIFKIMTSYFEKYDSAQKRSINSRALQISKNKNFDSETSLLEHANTSRYAESEETVISNYRQILNRTTSPLSTKTTAILNLADYLFNHRGKAEKAIQLMEEFYTHFSKNAIYIRLFANYLWANENRAEAVKKLSLFLHTNMQRNSDCDDKSIFELQGLYIMYASIYEISRKENIKEQKFLGNLSHTDFTVQNSDISKKMNAIFTYGIQVFERIKKMSFATFPRAVKQNYSIGFYHFIDICIRLNKYEKGKQIADFFIQEANQVPNLSFIKKREKIDMYSKNY
jgi:NACHT domain